MKCCKCGNELTDFESLVMLDVPNSAYCYTCSIHAKHEAMK